MTLLDAEFWRGRRVFLTGHTGFKGSWLSLWLQSLGASVTGYALPPPTEPNLFGQAQVADGLHHVEGDIRNAATLRQALLAAKPEIVLHLAAQALVRESYSQPHATFETNVMGTLNLLEATRACPTVKAVVVVTSDKCYENREWHWGYRENEAMGGADPYSASKGCTELLTASYRQSFFSDPCGPRLATARAGNVIGGGDYAKDRLLTDIMAAIRSGQPAQIRNPNAIRPWQHVLEPLAGYLLLAEGLHRQDAAIGSAYNLGPADDDARPVGWICEQLTARWGDNARWQHDRGEHPHEANYLKLDASLARSQLGWRPRLNLAEALDWIVQWHRAAERGEDLRAVTLEQIQTYQVKE